MPADVNIEQACREAIDRMTPAEKIQRTGELFRWARRVISLQILREKGEMSPERLKWEIALRMYGNSSQLRPLIERELARVPS